jgi:hypothetical protein
MKRRKSIKPDWWMAEHPPAACRKLMSKKTLELLDKIKAGTLTRKEDSANED